MKQIYLLAGVAAVAALGFYAWRKGQKKEAAKTAIQEAEIFDGTNWQGSMSQRLRALDLVSRGFPNMGGSANASPGRMEQIASGATRIAGWDGTL